MNILYKSPRNIFISFEEVRQLLVVEELKKNENNNNAESLEVGFCFASICSHLRWVGARVELKAKFDQTAKHHEKFWTEIF